MHALISVSDKTGVVELARALAALGATILSTGGTAKLLAEAGIAVTEVAEHTGFPEMLDGRVKTLHPTIHGGLLARRDLPEHVAALEQHAIAPIDLLVVNLYPFEATVAAPDCTLADAIENIDIGGPAMVRSAAKNWRDVAVLTDASQYAGVLDELKARGAVSLETRSSRSRSPPSTASPTTTRRSATTFLRSPGRATASPSAPSSRRRRTAASSSCRTCATARTRTSAPRSTATSCRRPGSLVTARQLQGKELSYNNIADADAAWECVRSFGAADAPAACVIVKHANPCGVAHRRVGRRGLRQGAADRSDLGLRRHPRLQRRGRRRLRRAHPRRQAVRRGADRAGLHERGAGHLRGEDEHARPADRLCRPAPVAAQCLRDQARRLGPLDPDRRQRRLRRRASSGS